MRRVAIARQSGGTWRVTREEMLLVSDSVRIRGTFMGPDGMLYLTTSDRRTDGRPDDRLYRIRFP